jgi:predicted nuclease with TOPRIM domain
MSSLSGKSRSAAQKEVTARLTQIRMQNRPPLASIGNMPPTPPLPPRRKRATLAVTLKVELAEKDAKITDLQVSLADYRDMYQDLSKTLADLSGRATVLESENATLNERIQALLAQNDTLERSLATTGSDLQKATQRIKRLERERTHDQTAASDKIEALESHVEEEEHVLRDAMTRTFEAEICMRDSQISQLSTKLSEMRSSRDRHFKEKNNGKRHITRLRSALDATRRALKDLRTFKTTKKGIFTSKTRRLCRQLSSTGCKHVSRAIRYCAHAFGIRVTKYPSRTTASRSVAEGGKLGEIQLGHEILNAPNFGESTDGTTIRNVTMESHCATMLVPSYDSDADDSNSATWTHATRFIDVHPALDHTAERQLAGSHEIAERIAKTYSDSPLAQREGKTFGTDDWYTKQAFQNMDHAQDGQKKFKLTAQRRNEAVRRKLANETLSNPDTPAFEVLRAYASVTEDELLKASNNIPLYVQYGLLATISQHSHITELQKLVRHCCAIQSNRNWVKRNWPK